MIHTDKLGNFHMNQKSFCLDPLPSNMFKPSSSFLTDRSKAALLLRIRFLSYCRVFLGNGWPLVGDVSLYFCHFSGSGVVFDCLDS